MLPVLRIRNSDLGWPTAVNLVGTLHNDFDRLVGRVFGEAWEGTPTVFRVDIREDANHYYVDAEMPGLTKDDVGVTLENGVLTIAGEKRMPFDEDKEDCHIRERWYGKFSRQFTLPTAVNEAKVQATLKDGILTITLDKKEEVKPKRISVNVG